jgi:hypothetical protein
MQLFKNAITNTRTAAQAHRLIILANYLSNLPKGYSHFDMSTFLEIEGGFSHTIGGFPGQQKRYNKEINHCGAVACAIGHGPSLADVDKEFALGKGGHETWAAYSDRLFGCQRCNTGFLKRSEWNWCFGGMWSHIDNTPQGAAQRIIYLLKKGMPEDYHHLEYSDMKLSIVPKYRRIKVTPDLAELVPVEDDE